MELQEILRFADERVFAKTGKHLDDLQEAILKEALQGRKYAKIAQERGCSEGYIRVAASELWKILSEAFDDYVSKVNVRSKLERAKYANISPTIASSNVTINNNVNLCQKTVQSPAQTAQTQPTSEKVHIDLSDAPELFTFYDRADELATLERLLVQDRCRIVELLGLSGIGKTAIALRLIEPIKTHFDYIIYRSLCFSPLLEITLTNLLQNFCHPTEIPQHLEGQLSQLFNYLRNYRCLIIFDDVQMLFSSGNFAGEYKLSFENYSLFFRRFAKNSHNSCLLLITSEKFREFTKIQREPCPVRSFVLGGLGRATIEILKEHQLSDEEIWDTLISTYQGNPLWLEQTASLIQELFKGKVSEFLQYEGLILCESMRSQLERQFQRLTLPEQAVIIHLANEDAPVTLQQLLNVVNLANSDLLNAMQSLRRRLLLDTKEQGELIYFKLNPVWKQYVKEQYPD